MSVRCRWAPCAALALLISTEIHAQTPTEVHAQPPKLDVKMGLWEMTATTMMGGQPPGIDTSKMTPEQKAAMEAAMKGMQGAHADVRKTCVTKQKLATSAFMMPDADGKNCQQTLTTNTSTTLDGTATCAGEQRMIAHIHIDALSPTSIKGKISISGTAQGRASTLDMAMSGRWLGADCGSVR